MTKKWRALGAGLLVLFLVLMTACGGGGSSSGGSGGGSSQTGSGSTGGSGTGSQGSDAQPNVRDMSIRAANFFPQGHPFGLALDFFAEEVGKRSDGKIKIETFHDAILGGEREVTEMVKNGSLEIADTGGVGMEAYGVKAVLVTEQPFLYKDLNHFAQTMDHVRDLLEKNVEAKGFKLLALRFAGPRITLAKKELRTFEDYEGLKLRVPELNLYVEFANALKAKPTIVSLKEVYSALQTGVADAYEGEASSILDNSFYEQAKYVHLTNHIFYLHYLVANIDWWNKLTPEEQQIFTEAGRASEEYDLQIVAETNEKALEELRSKGVTIIEYSDEELAKFRDAVVEVNRKLAESQGPEGVEIFNKMQEVLN